MMLDSGLLARSTSASFRVRTAACKASNSDTSSAPNSFFQRATFTPLGGKVEIKPGAANAASCNVSGNKILTAP